ncbi:MAG: Tfp pilus assembly protein FimT/FimU [Alphaproteobacteria bacterium]
MKEENKNQIVIPHAMGKSAENKALNAAGCWVSSGMTECGESGRSMVEMLGVLAVMGVLSVGGVAMYTTAMNKYRANELLNEASKRAVMVAGQLLVNPNAPSMSLAQFGDNTVGGATFGDTATIENGRIVLELTGVEDPICAQMKAAAGGNSAVAISESCSKLAFNADMSAVDFVFDGDDLPCVGDNCPGSSSSSASEVQSPCGTDTCNYCFNNKVHHCEEGTCSAWGVFCPCEGYWTDDWNSHICSAPSPCSTVSGGCALCHDGYVYWCGERSLTCWNWGEADGSPYSCSCNGVWRYQLGDSFECSNDDSSAPTNSPCSSYSCAVCHGGNIYWCAEGSCSETATPYSCSCEGVWQYDWVTNIDCNDNDITSYYAYCHEDVAYLQKYDSDGLRDISSETCKCTVSDIPVFIGNDDAYDPGEAFRSVCQYEGPTWICRDGSNVDRYWNGVLEPGEGCVTSDCVTGEVRNPGNNWCWN